jgi:hypothetical protein
MRLFSVVFCAVRAVREFDCRIVINKKTLSNLVIETYVFEIICVFSPDHRREL